MNANTPTLESLRMMADFLNEAPRDAEVVYYQDGERTLVFNRAVSRAGWPAGLVESTARVAPGITVPYGVVVFEGAVVTGEGVLSESVPTRQTVHVTL